MSEQILYVYLDCDWSLGPILVGRLFSETLRGSQKHSFEFDRSWLKSQAGLKLSAELESFPGRQYLNADKDMFGCFSDSMPDRWGRLLMSRREQINAAREGRPTKTLTSLDYLCGIDDFSRSGAFRFKFSQDGVFVNEGTKLGIPPLTSLKELVYAAQSIERNENKNILPEEKWLLQLLKPGSSLGGARPKATVIDERGDLWVAKFPSVNDTYDVGAWENFAYVMARKAGVEIADSKLMEVDAAQHHVFLVKRFDRNQSQRIHFASSMTMLGLKDGDGAQTGRGYLDIAESILSNCINVEQNLEQLFRRAAFNICIGNSDDHLRNHGFLLTKKGWTLSPAYDLNPTTECHQSLLINAQSDVSDLGLLRESASEYMLSQTRADAIVNEVLSAMKDWESVALRMHLAKRDIERFKARFIVSL